MADRFKFAEVRQEVIEMLKKDLLGPSSENEILNQNPRFEYIVGMLAPQTSEMIRKSRKSMEMLLSKGMQIILRAKTMIMSRSLQIDLKHRLPLASAFT